MDWVLFFDGECVFCSRLVRWVARRDRRGRIAFAPLQGELARQRGFSNYAAAEGGTMVVLRESDNRVFLLSDGWIELARALGGGWRIFALTRIVPKCLRDGVYRWLARHRHLLMGRADRCDLPDPELRKHLRD